MTTRLHPDPPVDDPLLRALEQLVLTASDVEEAVQMLAARAGRMRALRLEGADWREIVEAEERPLIAEMLTDTISRFEAGGTLPSGQGARAARGGDDHGADRGPVRGHATAHLGPAPGLLPRHRRVTPDCPAAAPRRGLASAPRPLRAVGRRRSSCPARGHQGTPT